MVTISLTRSEIISLAIAINDLSVINVGPYGYNMLIILRKFKKSTKDRQNKAWIQQIINDFVVRHKLKVATYKKSGK